MQLEILQWLDNASELLMFVGLDSLLLYVLSQRILELERENGELQRRLHEKERIADEKSVHLEEVRSSEEEAKRQLVELREERDLLSKELSIKHEAVDDLEDKVYLLEQE